MRVADKEEKEASEIEVQSLFVSFLLSPLEAAHRAAETETFFTGGLFRMEDKRRLAIVKAITIGTEGEEVVRRRRG